MHVTHYKALYQHLILTAAHVSNVSKTVTQFESITLACRAI